MSFKHVIEVTPHADGVHCGECLFREKTAQYYRCPIFKSEKRKSTGLRVFYNDCECSERCHACLEAERQFKLTPDEAVYPPLTETFKRLAEIIPPEHLENHPALKPTNTEAETEEG